MKFIKILSYANKRLNQTHKSIEIDKTVQNILIWSFFLL